MPRRSRSTEARRAARSRNPSTREPTTMTFPSEPTAADSGAEPLRVVPGAAVRFSDINPYTGEKVRGLEAPAPVAGGGRPRGKDPYRLKDGTRVPGVTTITGRFTAAE